ncbi:MAG: NAD(P)-dependent oxidoreductase [Candidatus Marinimicrobia bacterium]|nr:NAD(P)-dependent oxidoreductase [Candidatus Neomarinimicrobiota bacterium]
MKPNLPKVLITGASGFVGRYLIARLQEKYIIYAFARKTQKRARVPVHKNIKWILVNIANEERLAHEILNIKQKGRVDFVIHLAAYYDFGNKPNPEYERTNVFGTELMLKYSKLLLPKRFIFASSIAACNFPKKGESLDETTPLDADFPYAVSKRKAESLVKEYSQLFPCSIIRFAAVYSDWCEYGPLYMFLNTWFSKSWNSIILGGKGESAVPYIHESCLNRLILLILQKTDGLPQIDTYIASPNGSTSHKELYDLGTKLFYGQKKFSIKMPSIIAKVGVRLRYWLGSLIGRPPFERPWMTDYIDLKLTTDATYTMKTLDWEPSPHRLIERRLLFLVEHLRSLPIEWYAKNQIALKISSADRPSLLISNDLMSMQNEIIDEIFTHIFYNQNKELYQSYQLMNSDYLTWYIEVIYNLIITSVRTGNRLSLVNYAHSLAVMRKREGFNPKEVCQAIIDIGEIVIKRLISSNELIKYEGRIRDTITISTQMMVDEIQDTFDFSS